MVYGSVIQTRACHRAAVLNAPEEQPEDYTGLTLAMLLIFLLPAFGYVVLRWLFDP